MKPHLAVGNDGFHNIGYKPGKPVLQVSIKVWVELLTILQTALGNKGGRSLKSSADERFFMVKRHCIKMITTSAVEPCLVFGEGRRR